MRTATLTLLFTIVGLAQTLDNQSVLDLVRKGVSPEEICRVVKSAPDANFSMAPAWLEALSKQGVPDSVIKAMAYRQSHGPDGRASSAPAAVDPPPAQATAMPAMASSMVERPTAQAPAARDLTNGKPVTLAELSTGFLYASIDTNGLSQRVGMSGWQSSVAINFTRNLAAESEVSGYYNFRVLGQDAWGVDYAYLAGPRVNFRPLFFHVLAGVDTLTGAGFGIAGTQAGFALAFGAGAQIRLGHRWAITPGADFVMTHHNIYGGPLYTQNNFRVGVSFTYLAGPIISH